MNTAVRDIQRSRLYSAEQLVARVLDRANSGTHARLVDVAGSRLALPIERRFADLDSVQRYVDTVLAFGPVRERWPTRGLVQVRARRGQHRAHYEHSGSVLAIPFGSAPRPPTDARWALRELVVLHELTHHLCRDTAGPSHGPQFAAAYLDLVQIVIGPEVALLLRVTFDDCRVVVHHDRQVGEDTAGKGSGAGRPPKAES